MAFRLDRLIEMLALKRLGRAEFQRRTGVASDQMGRILSGERGPGDKLAIFVAVLELDADYLLDTWDRYEDMPALRVAAHVALDRFVVRRERSGAALPADEVAALRHLAQHSAKPPIWVEEWETHHERTTLSAPTNRQTGGDAPRPRVHRPRRARA